MMQCKHRLVLLPFKGFDGKIRIIDVQLPEDVWSSYHARTLVQSWDGIGLLDGHVIQLPLRETEA